LALQLLHPLLELHEGLPEPLDLLVRERSGLHPPERLPLHQLPQQLHEGEDQLREALFDTLRVGVDAARQRRGDPLELVERLAPFAATR
jgi:hypothetical protein